MPRSALDAKLHDLIRVQRTSNPSDAHVAALMRFLLNRTRAVESENFQLRKQLQLPPSQRVDSYVP
jgi:hypothetical protein